MENENMEIIETTESETVEKVEDTVDSETTSETAESEVPEATEETTEAEATEESKDSVEKSSEPEKKKRDPNLPKWVTSNYKINEPLFCKFFTEEFALACMNGIFYNYEGAIDEKVLKTVIYKLISPHIKNKLSATVNSIVESLRLHCYKEPCKPDTDRIHVNNGIVMVDGEEGTPPTFIREIDYCRNRLNINYNPDVWNGVYYPSHFLIFLYDLLEPDDITTLQEFLGYTMIASTKGQVMMSIIGSGGEGKSRIGVVLQEIYKNNMVTGNYQRIETDRFFRYNLINKLLILDDDMQMTALSSTGYIKTLITSEIPIDVEAKGQQSQQEYLYSRILTFGNGTPKALYDHSVGFARRLIILTTKPKPENRRDDPFIAEKFLAEKELIFCWMLDGLRRLIANNFRFTISDKTKANVEEIMRGSCNVIDFLEDENSVAFEPDAKVTSKKLYEMYSSWCEKNRLEALKRITFIKWLNDNAVKYHITYDTHILESGGVSRVRGFLGIRLNGFIN